MSLLNAKKTNEQTKIPQEHALNVEAEEKSSNEVDLQKLQETITEVKSELQDLYTQIHPKTEKEKQGEYIVSLFEDIIPIESEKIPPADTEKVILDYLDIPCIDDGCNSVKKTTKHDETSASPTANINDEKSTKATNETSENEELSANKLATSPSDEENSTKSTSEALENEEQSTNELALVLSDDETSTEPTNETLENEKQSVNELATTDNKEITTAIAQENLNKSSFDEILIDDEPYIEEEEIESHEDILENKKIDSENTATFQKDVKNEEILTEAAVAYLQEEEEEEHANTLRPREEKLVLQRFSLFFPTDLYEDIKDVIIYMDKILENLPENQVKKFTKSKHFETYKNIFLELDLM
ncbi:MAG: hypothetical protein ACRC6H_05805 [Culicoidibacterales bacterium]